MDNINQNIENKTKSLRSSDFELLRIISMLFIIMHHFVFHGILASNPSQTTFIISNIFVPLGKIGYVSFVILTMWFMLDSKFRFSKIIIIYFEAVFYSLIIAIVLTATKNINLPVYRWISIFFPFGLNHAFVATYLAFMLISPFLKILLSKFNKKQLYYATIVLFILQIISVFVSKVFELTFFFPSDILFFSFLYFFIHILKTKNFAFLNNKLLLLLFFLLCWSIMFCLNAGYIKTNNAFLNRFFAALHNDQVAILDLIAGLCLFYLFKFKTKFYSKTINLLSSTTLGVLLIHDNILFCPFIWRNIIHCERFANYGALIIPVAIALSICIYLCASIIDLARMHLLEKNILKLKPIASVCCKIDKMWSDYQQ